MKTTSLILVLVASTVFAQDAVDKLLTVKQGTLPIILSVPHGGKHPIPNATIRKGVGVAKFVTVRDGWTDELAEKIGAALEKKLAGKPHLVIARFERKYVDVNRPAKDAYESDAAKSFYDAYHKALKSARDEVERDWGRGLVIDVHGQGVEPNAIFRGTSNWESVSHLTTRFGKLAVTGPKGVFGVLGKRGVSIIPANDSANKEDAVGDRKQDGEGEEPRTAVAAGEQGADADDDQKGEAELDTPTFIDGVSAVEEQGEAGTDERPAGAVGVGRGAGGAVDGVPDGKAAGPTENRRERVGERGEHGHRNGGVQLGAEQGARNGMSHRQRPCN